MEGEGARSTSDPGAAAAEPNDNRIREAVDLDPLRQGLTFYLLKVPDHVVDLIRRNGGHARFTRHVEEGSGAVTGEDVALLVTDPSTKDVVECPVEFTDPPTADRPFVVLSHGEGGSAWKAEGTVHQRGVVKPPTSASFTSLHRHDADQVSRTAPAAQSSGPIGAKRKEPAFPKTLPPRKMQQTARTSLSKGELQVRLQTLFTGERTQWTLTDVHRATQQPMQPLKDAMKEICTFNPSTKAYELRPEYRI